MAQNPQEEPFSEAHLGSPEYRERLMRKLNYLIAATLPRDEGEKAAQFLASRGLEIALVPVDNQGSRWVVVVLQGVAAKDLGGPAARNLEQRLQSLGREYKQMKGPTVFNDPWWKKHTK